MKNAVLFLWEAFIYGDKIVTPWKKLAVRALAVIFFITPFGTIAAHVFDEIGSWWSYTWVIFLVYTLFATGSYGGRLLFRIQELKKPPEIDSERQEMLEVTESAGMKETLVHFWKSGSSTFSSKDILLHESQSFRGGGRREIICSQLFDFSGEISKIEDRLKRLVTMEILKSRSVQEKTFIKYKDGNGVNLKSDSTVLREILHLEFDKPGIRLMRHLCKPTRENP